MGFGRPPNEAEERRCTCLALCSMNSEEITQEGTALTGYVPYVDDQQSGQRLERAASIY